MRGSRRSLLRHASILLVLAWSGLGLAAPALAQGPTPDPAPAPPVQPKPESPGSQPQPSPPRTTTPQPPPPPPPVVRSRPIQPPAPPPPAPPAAVLPTPALAPPPASPPPAPVRRARRSTKRQSHVTKKEPSRARSAKQAVKKRVPRLPAAAAESSSRDSTLLIGGLALVVLVLGDTIFLALSTRFLRET